MLAVGGRAFAGDCLDVETYPGTSECYVFPTNCIPEGWVTYPGGCPF
jgi:hypothetical protein